MRTQPYVDRRDAGRSLAPLVRAYVGRDDVVVLGLPRGGVPVAFEVARVLSAPLDVCVVRKLGVPGREEFAMGAIASGGAEVLDESIIEALAIPRDEVEAVRRREHAELARREALYRGQRRPPPEIRQRQVMVVDDGLATGASMTVALQALQALKPARLIAVAPIGAPDACARVQEACDSLICPWRPAFFSAVGEGYEHFDETPDNEVIRLLDEASQAPPGGEHEGRE